jgi:hypothetical protein
VACHWKWSPPSCRSLPLPRINSNHRTSAPTAPSIAFHDSESLDDFSLHLMKMVHELEILGDPDES